MSIVPPSIAQHAGSGRLQRRAATVAVTLLLCLPLTAGGGNALAAEAPEAPEAVAYVDSVSCAVPDCTAVNTIPVDGGQPSVVAVNARDQRWSPDGARLAYGADSSCGRVVQVRDADGSNVRTVTPCNVERPAWSPDGTRLALLDHNRGAFNPDVVVQDVNGQNRRVVFRYDASPDMIVNAQGVEFSPDGSKLAVVATEQTHAETQRIFIVNIEGSGLRRLPTPAVSYLNGPAVWSPDGSRLLYAAPRPRTIRADGTDDRAVRPDTVRVKEATWSRDGRQILQVEQSEGCCERLTLSPAPSSATSVTLYCLPAEARASGLEWRSDESGIVFAQAAATGQEPDLYRLDVAGARPTCDPAGNHSSDNPAPRRLTSSGGFSPDLPTRVVRMSGATRIDTAISVSRSTRSSAGTVVVARSDLYPDALTAGPLAAKLAAPLLLSSSDATTAALRAEVSRLGARTAVLIGDTTALSARVEADLRTAGVTTVRRIGGQTRFDTAKLISAEVGGTSAYVARGVGATPSSGWEDAAAVSALAAYQKRPILLTTTDRLPAATEQALADQRIGNVTIVGGTAAVSQAVAEQMSQNGISVSRVAGANRYATSAAVADASVTAGMGSGRPYLTTGRNFPDALAAGPAAALTGSVLLLVDPKTLDNSTATRDWLDAHHSYTVVNAVGGPDVVSPVVTTRALQIAAP